MIDKVLLYDSLIFLISVAVILLSEKKNLDENFRNTPYRLSLAVLPFVVIISLTSALISYNSFEPVYILLAFSPLILPLSSTKLDIDKAYVISFIFGSLLASLLYFVSSFSLDYIILGEIFLFAGLFVFPFALAVFYFDFRKFYVVILFSHFLDASSTRIALRKGLRESRVLANLFLEIFGVYGIFLMKALIFIPITYYILEKNYAKELIFLLSIYGLVLGLRNYFLVLLTL